MLAKSNHIYTNIDPDFSYTSLTVQLMDTLAGTHAYVFLGEREKFELSFQNKLSIPLKASKPTRYLSFFSGLYEGKGQFIFQYSKK